MGIREGKKLDLPHHSKYRLTKTPSNVRLRGLFIREALPSRHGLRRDIDGARRAGGAGAARIHSYDLVSMRARRKAGGVIGNEFRWKRT